MLEELFNLFDMITDVKKGVHFVIMFLIGLIVVVCLTKHITLYKLNQYLQLETKKSYKGKIENITYYKLSTIIRLKGSKYLLDGADNFDYKIHRLSNFLIVNDYIIKKAGSDTLFVLRNNNKSYFILNKVINRQ